MNYLAQSFSRVHRKNLLFELQIQNNRMAVSALKGWNNNQRLMLFVLFDDAIENINAYLRLIHERDETRPRVARERAHAALDRRTHALTVIRVMSEPDWATFNRAANVLVAV